MLQVAQRDQAAFAELFDRHGPVVLGVLIRLMRQKTLAEQVLEETFLHCWLKADGYRPEQGSPRAWLLGIATWLGAARLRQERARSPKRETVKAPYAFGEGGRGWGETVALRTPSYERRSLSSTWMASGTCPRRRLGDSTP
jgi:DNA-directed RNA polymerase specialized sigma24 family protein